MGGDHDVSCDLAFEIDDDAVLALQVAASHDAGPVQHEELTVTDGRGQRCETTEIGAPHGGRVHLVTAPTGRLEVAYRATLQRATPPAAQAPQPLDDDLLAALRPSRYCPSDQMGGFAVTTFPDDEPAATRARRVASWVFEHLALAPGSSGHTDSAVDTLLLGAGVCRDFAHLTIALCRALGVPARFASVYAPGLLPMEMHAVVEVHTEHGWEVLDPTRRAPRSTLLRIATGRDAADTAFATTVSGSARLDAIEVLATTAGELPADDHESVCVLG